MTGPTPSDPREPVVPSLDETPSDPLVEIGLVALIGCGTVAVGWALVGEDALARQAVAWVANVLMLLTIWLGLRRRGEGWEHLGLRFRRAGARAALWTVAGSVVVFVVAIVAFVLGGVLAAGLAGEAAASNMSGYAYLQGNLPMLLLALPAVWLVSSIGEEVIYRGFLIHRFAEAGGGGRVAWAVAVAISAVVFGLAHFAWGVIGIVQTTLMGLALGLAYLVVGRNLWVLVLAHAYMDTLLLIQLYVGAGGQGAG